MKSIVKEKKYFKFSTISETRGILLGIATLIIVAYHSQMVTIENVININFFKEFIGFLKLYGGIGVDVFLILSGFGLYYSFSKNSNLKDFYKKRLVRILPEVFIMASIVSLFVPGNRISNFLYTITCTRFFVDGNLDFWFFSLILILYLVFPILYRIIKKFDWKAVVIMVITIFASILFIRTYYLEVYEHFEIMLYRIPAFIVGIYLGKLAINDVKISRKFILLFLFIFIVFVGILELKNEFVLTNIKALLSFLSVFFVLIFSYVFSLFKENIFTRFLIWVGSYSLEVYLLYEFLLKKSLNLFPYKDKNYFNYAIAIFCITMIYSVILKMVSNDINNKVIEKKL